MTSAPVRAASAATTAAQAAFDRAFEDNPLAAPDLGLTEDRIVAVARDSRSKHPTPPDGPRALDRAMERAANVTSNPKLSTDDKRRKRGGKPADAPRASMDEIAGFYAGLVNGDGYLPSNAISNTVRNAMLERGLVTTERLRARGVL